MSGTDTTPASSTDPNLIRRVQAQDREAWSELVEWASPLVYFWCRQAQLQSADQEDVFQQVFLAIHRGLGGFSHKSFRGWLFKITRNAIADLFRRRQAAQQAVGGSDAYRVLLAQADQRLSEPSTDVQAKQLQAQAAVERIRVQCSEVEWQVVVRMVMQDQPAADVAAELGRTAAGVRQIKARVLHRLRQDLGGLLT